MSNSDGSTWSNDRSRSGSEESDDVPFALSPCPVPPDHDTATQNMEQDMDDYGAAGTSGGGYRGVTSGGYGSIPDDAMPVTSSDLCSDFGGVSRSVAAVAPPGPAIPSFGAQPGGYQHPTLQMSSHIGNNTSGTSAATYIASTFEKSSTSTSASSSGFGGGGAGIPPPPTSLSRSNFGGSNLGNTGGVGGGGHQFDNLSAQLESATLGNLNLSLEPPSFRSHASGASATSNFSCGSLTGSLMGGDDALSVASTVDSLASGAADASSTRWDVPYQPGAPLAQIPPCYPLERTSKFVPHAAADPGVVAKSIMATLARRSIVARYYATRPEKPPKAHCRTGSGVEFVVRLYGGKGRFAHGVIVEVQRRSGFSVGFHQDCNAVLDAASGVVAEETKEQDIQESIMEEDEGCLAAAPPATTTPAPVAASAILQQSFSGGSSSQASHQGQEPRKVSPDDPLEMEDVVPPPPQALSRNSSGNQNWQGSAFAVSASSSAMAISPEDMPQQATATAVDTSAASQFTEADRQLLIAESLLRKNLLDANLLGMKMLSSMTDPTAAASSPDEARSNSSKIFSHPRYEAVRRTIFDLVENRRLPNTPSYQDHHTQQQQQEEDVTAITVEDSFVSLLRNQAVRICFQALDGDSSPTSSSGGASPTAPLLKYQNWWTLNRLVPCLLRDVELAEIRPNEASMAARCLTRLAARSAEARSKLAGELGAAPRLADAYRVGRERHAALAGESSRCAAVLGVQVQ